MTVDSRAARWVGALTQLETAVAESERLVEQGRLEEFRALPVPVVDADLPTELVDRARSLQERMTALTVRVVEAMATTRAHLELAATERAERPERASRPAPRQWQPAYVDARA